MRITLAQWRGQLLTLDASPYMTGVYLIPLFAGFVDGFDATRGGE